MKQNKCIIHCFASRRFLLFLISCFIPKTSQPSKNFNTVESGYRYKIPCFYDELFSGQSEMKMKALDTTNGKYN